jgi:TolB-like protein
MVPHPAYHAGPPIFRDSEFRSAFCRHRARGRISNRDAPLLGYEFTPEGIVRTEDLDPVQARSVQRASGRILDFIIIGALLLVVAMLIVGRLPFYRQTGESISQKSIAVLPFENRSEDKANAYFADGIQDEILTLLSKITDLKVISRTSTRHYKSAPENLPEIARQLGVAHILEGSVQKSGDAVRVNVQLIKAASDSHLWAETFDRKLIDIFSVKSEVARAIADQLQAKLTGREEQALAVRPTKNPEAYDAYLRGLAFEARGAFTSTSFSPDLEEKAIGSYERPVQLDPNFAIAWARLSRADAFVARSMGASATFSSCHANWWTSSAVRRSYGRLPRRLGTDPTPGLLNLFVTSSFGKPTACRTGTYSPLSSPYNMDWQRKALYPTTPWKA